MKAQQYKPTRKSLTFNLQQELMAAYRWQGMFDSGTHQDILDRAEAKVYSAELRLKEITGEIQP